MTRSRRNFSLALAIAAALVVGACTTVPTTSAPTVIRPIAENPPPVVCAPAQGGAPRNIVAAFLNCNGKNDPNHNGARQFLTTEERPHWSDSSATIIDFATPSNLAHHRIVVSGREIGTIDDSGAYIPALRGDGTGTGGLLVKQSIGLQKIKGKWRISSLSRQGLLIDAQQFQLYQQRALYFFDASNQHLVPDPRYTQMSAPGQLANWLVNGLADAPRGGPQSGLQSALPNQTGPTASISTKLSSDGKLIKIEIPGAAQLSASTLNRLAAQIAQTLAQVSPIEGIEITDGGVPVRIPSGQNGTIFNLSNLSSGFGVDVTGVAPDLYYVRGGGVYDALGQRVHGKVGSGSYGLNSVALRAGPDGTTNDLLVAGVRGAGAKQYLDIGTPAQLFPTKLSGDLSRPAWAPNAPEAWVGSGQHLFRVTWPSQTVRTVPVDVPEGVASGTIIAVRLSPDGSRVALVLRSNARPHTSQVYVGGVVRTGSDVRVTNLTPISPQAIKVNDVAWNDQLKLFVIGTNLITNSWGLWEVQCDGSLWTLRSNFGLPQAPGSLTVASGSVAVVSAGDTVWRQQAGSWEPLGVEDTHGTNPIYNE
ncbi:MAG TPA: LpqB family beta-propeller domain-containing protein [Jatrophihabitantaceae bacterium]|nr:LpqB family beta-propeller domain-containing protein [Jatrophihabitantaceae bacterium]